MQGLDIHLFVIMPVIYFVYGMSFFMFGVTLLIENLSAGTPPRGLKGFLFSPAGYLSLFGLLVATYAFSGMLLVLYYMPPPLILLRFLFLSAAFYCLFKFGQGLKGNSKASAGENAQTGQPGRTAAYRAGRAIRALPVPEALLACAFIGSAYMLRTTRSLDWVPEAQAVLCYFSGFPAAVLAAFSLLRYGNIFEKPSYRYRIAAAVGFFLYALSVLITPRADFFPASFLNYDTFSGVMHVPVQLFHALSAVILTFSLFRWFRLSKEFYSVRFKALFHLVFAVAIPGIIVISAGLYLISGALLDRTVREHEKIVALASERVASFMDNAVEKVGYRVMLDRSGSPDYVTDIFVSLIRNNLWINGFVFFDGNEREILRIERNSAGPRITMRAGADKKLKELASSFVSDTVRVPSYRINGHDDRSLTLEVPGTKGKMAIVLALEELYEESFSGIQQDEGHHLLLLDQQRNIVAPERIIHPDEKELLALHLLKGISETAFTSHGTSYSIFVSGIGPSAWSVVMKIPSREITSPIFHIYKVFLFGSLAVYVCSLALGLIFFRNLTGPISRIMSRIEELGRGGSDSKLRVKTSDELQVLAEEVEKTAGLLAEKRKLEREMMRIERIASVGRLAAGIAHEVNNPLAIISGYCQTLLRDADTGDDLAKVLGIIEKQTFRCKKIVNELLAFTRESRRENVPVDVCRSIREALALFPGGVPDGKFRIDFGPCAGASLVMGDPDRFHQLFINLLMNALDAMEKEGGTLLISVRTFEDGPEKKCEIIFRDTGCGIAPAELERVFDPFFTTKEVGKGTGLGLYVSYIIVSEHKGRIWAESTVGKGTAFHIVFPALPAVSSEIQMEGTLS